MSAFHQLHHLSGSALGLTETRRHYPMEEVQIEERSEGGGPGTGER